MRLATVLILLITAAFAHSQDQSPLWGPICHGDGSASPLDCFLFFTPRRGIRGFIDHHLVWRAPWLV